MSNDLRKILFIFGTRPEAIKLAPVIRKFSEPKSSFIVKTCITAQHREMLDQVLNFFRIKVDYDLNLMKPNQSLFDITSNGLKALENVINLENPDIIFVQGDTTTAFVGALAGFYKKVKVAHVEAGLRSFDKYSPYPEEMNRVLIGRLADYHFAPTEKAKKNLKLEGIKSNIWVVGNTIIDALFLTLEIINQDNERRYREFFKFLDFSKKIILVTGHRRENFGEPFKNICLALKKIVDVFEDVEIVYPVHLNPNVRKPVYEILSNHPRVHLIEPLEYPYLVWIMNKAYLVLTDSGGIQEEAPSLGKPVLVMRENTERIEGIEAGTTKLVGTDKERIFLEVRELLTRKEKYRKMAFTTNPYGDGKAALRILEIIKRAL